MVDISTFNSLDAAMDHIKKQNEFGRSLFEKAPEWQKTLDKGDYCIVLTPGVVTAWCEVLGDISEEDEPKIDPMFVFVRSFSPMTWEKGDIESTYRTNVTMKISKEIFEEARELNWPQFVGYGAE